MKAAVYHGTADVRVEDVVRPTIGAGEILVKVKACAICGGDLRTFRHGHKAIHPPIILGHEIAGVIEEVGAGIDRYHVGDRVIVAPGIGCGACSYCLSGRQHLCYTRETIAHGYDGGFAEYCLIPSDWHLVLSSNPDVPLENLSLVEPATVAQHALRRGTLAAGEKIVIIGAGPIGIMEARWAEIFGAGKIALLEIDDVKIEFARARNLTVYDVKDPNCIAQVLRDFGRVDVVIEGTGTGSGCNTAIQLCRAFGRIVLMGNPHRDTTLTLDNHSLILRKELNVLGMWNSHYAPLPFNEWDYTVAKIDSGELAVADLITHRASLAGLKALFDGIHDRSITICKAIYSADEKD